MATRGLSDWDRSPQPGWDTGGLSNWQQGGGLSLMSERHCGTHTQYPPLSPIDFEHLAKLAKPMSSGA